MGQPKHHHPRERWICDLQDKIFELEEEIDAYDDSLDKCQVALKKYKAQTQWISVEDRLPELNQPVLCCGKDNNYYINKIIRMECYKTWYKDEPIYWMPLPKLPEDE